MGQYLFEKYPEKINTGQFRDNDNKWVKRYNTAYNGEYMITYDRDKFIRGKLTMVNGLVRTKRTKRTKR